MVEDAVFRTPNDLAQTPAGIRRIVVIGSCLGSAWPQYFEQLVPGCQAAYILFNNLAELPDDPPFPVEQIDFAVIQIPLRGFLPEQTYFALRHDDIEGHRQLFENAVDRLRLFLRETMRWNARHGLLTFVSNFIVPQQNPMGRLFERYDLRNYAYFVEELNRVLWTEVTAASNAFVFDVDQVAASLGKRFIQDDVIWQVNHGAVFTDGDFESDQARIEPAARLTSYYPSHAEEFVIASTAEIVASYRSLKQIDSVKMVVVDLDDTLWRGVAAEDDGATASIEGWPLGFIEALCFLKKRGILLAIVSKNDEAKIEELWDSILYGVLWLDDFVVRKINWRSKAENLAEILREVNLLPKSVVFVDDNPVERAALKAAFPDLRVLGSDPYLLRRILLWSAETQVASLTGESAARTEMVKAQVERESLRAVVSREEFLGSLNLKVTLFPICGVDSDRFPRALELLNKTNQFNTTGKRWSREECARAFSAGTIFYAFEAEDRFSRYGLIGIAVLEQATIAQFVMSCRVMGLDIELAVLAELQNLVTQNAAGEELRAEFRETAANAPSRDLYERAGFHGANGTWTKPIAPPAEIPPFIELVLR